MGETDWRTRSQIPPPNGTDSRQNVPFQRQRIQERLSRLRLRLRLRRLRLHGQFKQENTVNTEVAGPKWKSPALYLTDTST